MAQGSFPPTLELHQEPERDRKALKDHGRYHRRKRKAAKLGGDNDTDYDLPCNNPDEDETSSVPRRTEILADLSRFDSREANRRYFEGQCLDHANNGGIRRMVSISQARGNDKFAESFTELELQHAMLLSKLSSTLKPSQLTDLGNLLKATEALTQQKNPSEY